MPPRTENNSSGLPYVKRFSDPAVYRAVRSLQQATFEATRRFPKEETYSLTDQIRRAVRSIGAQIAEAWGKRDHPRSFVSKLSDADSEQLEAQHWIIVAVDCGYLTRDDGEALFVRCKEIGRMLAGMKRTADRFCRSPRRNRTRARTEDAKPRDATTEHSVSNTEH